MARLPTVLDQGSTRGATPSTNVARPVTGALQDLAQGISTVGKALEVVDDKQAKKILLAEQATFEPTLAESAARYDGRQSGFAAQATEAFDQHFKGVMEREDIPGGVRLALRRQVDAYKADVGGRAIGIESEKRAGVIAGQEQVKQAQAVGAGFAVFQKNYGEAYQSLYDNYDGSERNLVTGAERTFEAARQAALEATPEAQRPALEIRLAAQRPQILAQAMEAQDQGHTAYVASKVKETGEATLNSVLTNPAGYAMAAGNAEDLAAGLPARLRKPFLDEYQGRLASARVEGLMFRGDLNGAKAELDSGKYDKILPPQRKEALIGEVQARSAKQASDMLEAFRYGGDVDPGALRAAVAASGDAGLKAHAEYAIAVGAGEAGALESLAGGKKSAGFQSAVNFVIDKNEGGDALVVDDNGRGPSRFGINQGANPDLNVTTLTRGQAVGRYRRYWNSIGGERLPDALALVAFDAAVNQGEGTAKQMLAQSGGDVGQLLALREAAYRDLAKEPGQAKNLKGWLARLDKVRGEAARLQAFANVEDGLSSDPIKFALGGPTRSALAAVPPLPDQIEGAGFATALRGRLQVGQTMNRTYRAPLRLLTNAEATFYGDMIARDPVKAVDFAETSLAAVGPQATRGLLSEIGQKGDVGTTLHLAQLAASGLDTFARQAAKGLALKGGGQKLEKPQADEITAEVKRVETVFHGQPELRAAVAQTAEGAMLADRLSGVEKTAEAYVNSALGATARGGRRFGGVVDLNHGKTVIPPWLDAGYADDALEIMARYWDSTGTGPVYTNGKPIPARAMSQLQLQLTPSGRYRMLDRQGAAMVDKRGKVFDFDWDDAKSGLRAQLGGKVVVQ
jgi:hypothetical protein